MAEYTEIIERRMDSETPTGICTGIGKVDAKVPAIEYGSYVAIGGTPGAGKTALAAQLLSHAVFEQATPTLLFSSEMRRDRIAGRVAQHLGQHDFGRDAYTGGFSEDELRDFERVVDTVKDAPFFIDDTSGIAIEDLMARARGAVRDLGVKLVCVDYIQLLKERGRSDSMVEKLMRISGELKALAQNEDIIVVVLTQLTQKKDGSVSAFFSNKIEQDADLFFILEGAPGLNESEPEVAERTLLVGKYRDGGMGGCKLTYNKPVQTFVGDTGTSRTEADDQAGFKAAEDFVRGKKTAGQQSGIFGDNDTSLTDDDLPF
jgi:replicative DNA helicase